MKKELLQQTLIERCRKDAADRDCPYFARDTLTKVADMLATISQPVLPATSAKPAQPIGGEVTDALEWIDNFIAHCNGDDKGSCESVNILRKALTIQPAEGDAKDARIKVLEDALTSISELHPRYEGDWTLDATMSDFGGNADDYARERALMLHASTGSKARAAIEATSAKPANPQLLKLVLEQAEDEALWCKAHTIIESVLQAALRKLHVAIETQPVPLEGDAKDAEQARLKADSDQLEWLIRGKRGSRIWDHVFEVEQKQGHNFVKEVLIAAIASQKGAP